MIKQCNNDEPSFATRFGYLLGGGIFIFIIVFVIYTVLKPSIPETALEKFAACITDKNIEFYGTDTCSHCINQKESLAEGFKFINYINCDFNRDKCTQANIKAYPTWRINGNNHTGEKSLNSLSQLTNCSLN